TRCEHALSALATGVPIRRAWARYHVARCPHCAAAQRKLESAVEALSGVPPLTAAERRLWTAAISEDVPALLTKARGRRAAIVAFAFTVAVAVPATWWTLWRPGLETAPGVAPPSISQNVAKTEPLPGMEALRRDALALAGELEELRRRAELL